MAAQVQDEDDEPDEWYSCRIANQDPSFTDATADRDKRIFSTGCAGEFTIRPDNIYLIDVCFTEEQLKLNDCYYDKKDWRICKKEVSR